MKVTPDDPRLSAYLFGELSPEESAVIERAAASDPAIRMSLDELKKMAGFLDGVFGASRSSELMPPQREAIRRASRDAGSHGKVAELASARRGLKPWVGGLAAAAAVTIAAVLMSRMDIGGPSSPMGGMALSDEVALLPMPGPAAEGGLVTAGSDGDAVAVQRKGLDSSPGEFLREVSIRLEKTNLPLEDKLPLTANLTGFDRGPETRLPIVIGTSSLRWVHGWILDKQQLPPRNVVRIEELINTASLEGGDEKAGLRVVAESMNCPWNSDSKLVAVQIEAIHDAVRDLAVILRSDAGRRVLGSFPVRQDDRLPTILPAGRKTLVMVELRRDGEGPDMLEIHQGDDRKRLLAIPGAGSEASAGMRHSAALAGFGMWLRDEGVSAVQLHQILDGLEGDQDSVRAEVRRMMRAALELADSER